MKTVAAAVFLVCLAILTPTTHAQTPATDWDPRSGDAWVDRQLGDMNQYAARYRGAFIDELVRYRAAPRDLVTELVMKRGWAPGDVYYACAVAQLVGKPCRAVVEVWQQGHADGWRVVAKQVGLGSQPNAAGRMRQNITDSFERWGRPLAKPSEKATAKKNTAKKNKGR
jgi:hypothetical protein